MVVAPRRFLSPRGDYGIWLGRWAESGDKITNGGHDVLTLVGLEVAPHQLHVLLRHRPRSISRRQRARRKQGACGP
jgi:hypothetical protein